MMIMVGCVDVPSIVADGLMLLACVATGGFCLLEAVASLAEGNPRRAGTFVVPAALLLLLAAIPWLKT